VSIIGFVGLMAAITFGQDVAAHPVIGPMFDFDGKGLTWILIIYGFIASVLPVWLLLAPRDYLSTFLKIGTIVGLAIGIVVVAPELKMPALTQFVDGTGPVWSGNLFPFLFITIACGAVSGFHALISSGTTPKLIENETQARYIGYGGMLMESFVAIMALVAACVIEPGIYYAMNSPAAVIGTTPDQVAQVVSSWGFVVTPADLVQTAKDVGESTIISRAGGAPTLAVFILTAVDAGTRAGRFMLQDLLGTFAPSLKRTDSLPANLIATALCVAAWGYFLYQGVVDPLGGINTLWPLFGIANQMLAAIALTLGTVVLFKMKRDRYAWVTVLPTLWLLAYADKYNAAIADGKVLAPAKSLAEMSRVVLNDYINAGLCGIFIFVVVSIVVFGLRSVQRARNEHKPTARETPYETLPAAAGAD
jgi:carbon starvation protein